jgi:hypothetical protein
MLKTLGVFSPIMRELAEMTYQWEVPFELNDQRFVKAFGWSATPVADAVRETTRWAASRFLRRAA